MTFNVIECATQGRSHIKTNTPCQDKTSSLRHNDISVIALADGAGSAKFSHFGAEIATKRICKIFVEKFDIILDDISNAKKGILATLLKELHSESLRLNCEIKDLASTLLCVAVRGDTFIAFHLGDGIICALRNNEVKMISDAQNAEFANATFFTTSSSAEQNAEIIVGEMNNINAFAIMSDGVAPSFYDKSKGQFAKALLGVLQKSVMISQEKMQERLQRSLDSVISKMTIDDCSLAILARSDEFVGYQNLTGEQKKWLFEMEGNSLNYNKIRLFDKIIMALNEPKEFDELLPNLPTKAKYLEKHLAKLCELGIIDFDGKYYKAQVRIE